MIQASKVLVIEDDQSMRWVIEKSLTREGYQVATASGGMDGLSLARSDKPDRTNRTWSSSTSSCRTWTD